MGYFNEVSYDDPGADFPATWRNPPPLRCRPTGAAWARSARLLEEALVLRAVLEAARRNEALPFARLVRVSAIWARADARCERRRRPMDMLARVEVWAAKNG